MNYRELAPDEIHRIGEVERIESVTAVLVATRGTSVTGFSVGRFGKSPPVEIKSWGERGTQVRIDAWKPILDQSGYFYGAFEKDRLVGFAILGSKGEDGTGVIEALFVDRDNRRTGIALRLMQRVEQAAHTRAMRSLTLCSNATESAAEFYLRLGFTVIEANIAGQGMTEGLPGDIRMTKDLDVA